MKAYKKVILGKEIYIQIYDRDDQLHNQLYSRIDDQLNIQPHTQLSNQLHFQLRIQIAEEIRFQIHDHLIK